MSQPLDTIIIGAGTAGLAALREVRKRTERYLIVNEGPWGTTCARVGCMPSKALIEAANAFHRRHTFEEFGLRGASALTADLPSVPEEWLAFGDRMLTTDTLFEQSTLGPRIAVIGMGPIGVEISQALARLGLQVAAFTTGDTLAGLSDPVLN